MSTHLPDTDALIQSVASRQHGVVTRSCLTRVGVAVHAIEYRASRGRLRRLHRDVYAVGPVSGRYQREMAAVLACGSRAVLSHRSAAVLWGLLSEAPLGAPVDVTCPRPGRKSRAGICVHRTRRLPASHTGAVHGIPVTNPSRTLLDLAGCLSASDLERTLAVAERLRLLRETDLADFVRRNGAGRSCAGLLQLLRSHPAFTRSEAEARFLALVRSGALPTPKVNSRVAGFEVDFLWPDHSLIVEVDGFRYHSNRTSFESDRERDSALVAAGFRVIRVTWRQLTRTPEAVLVRLAQSLVRVPAGTP